MIRTVNIGMAVYASVSQDTIVRGVHTGVIVQRARMTIRVVAPLAQQRRCLDQHLIVMRSVRVMAVQAIFAHRRMLMKERPAFFGVAAVAKIGDLVIKELFWHSAVVGVVAVVAGDFSIHDRHVRGAAHLPFYRAVAGETNIGPRGLG